MPINLVQFDNTGTVSVPTADELAALAARVAVLEAGTGPAQPPPPGGGPESPDGTKITPGVGVVVDANGAHWTLTATSFIQKDAVNAYQSWQSHELVYHASAVNILGLDGKWYKWNGTAFVAGTAPPNA